MNEFETGRVYSGFTLNRVTYVKEVGADLFEFEHNKSGAKLLYVNKNDDNKVFSAAFRTTPEDSTGVFHILEHSVLCGSDRYPVKEPFVDLIKGSMQTFLNAFTFPDKTMYPCASCNDKDFSNLMSVYLDAVFCPAIYKHPEIFKQEGWHYELLDKDEDPVYKGVVFNEMKGSFSSVDSQIYSAIDAALFPDTCYRHSSGGYPPAITDLTYEQFINAHRKYYHPENSFLYLYGNMDLAEKLEFIDREYLSKYTRTGAVISIDLQKPVINRDVRAEFAIAPGEELANNSYAALCYVVGTFAEREKNLAFGILFDALAGSNESPLKKLFLDKGMAQDMWAYLSDGIAQPYAIFQLRKTDGEHIEKFEETLFEALRGFCEKGIDKELLRASLNQVEFHLREGKQGGTPAGLSYDLDIMDGWLYGSKPELYVTYEDALVGIKRGLEEGNRYFEELIEKYILNSDHMAKVVLTPSKTKQEEDEKREKEELKAYKASLSGEQIEKLIADTNALIEYQSAENTEEEKATIPTLSRSDIGDGSRDFPNEEITDGDIRYFYHDIDTHGIVYENFYFDMSVLGKEEFSYASLLTDVLTECATAHFSGAELLQEIKIKLGELWFGTDIYTNVADPDIVNPKFKVHCSVLEENVSDSVRIINEVLGSTVFTKDEIKKVIRQIANSMRNHIINSGSGIALDRLGSYLTKYGAYRQLVGGLGYFGFINDLVGRIDSDFEEIKSRLEGVCRKLFSPDRLIIGVSASRAAFDALRESCKKDITLEKSEAAKGAEPAPEYKGNEAICIPSGVNYCVKGVNYLKKGFKYSGKMLVLSKILSSDYLWNEIRVKGGAYGTGFSVGITGSAAFHSYRDPNVGKTLENYDKAADYLASFGSSGQSVLKYIISTVAALDRPITPRDAGGYIESSVFSGSDLEYKAKIRREVIETTEKDIEGYADLIRALTEENIVCTVGARSRIEEVKDVFDSITDL